MMKTLSELKRFSWIVALFIGFSGPVESSDGESLEDRPIKTINKSRIVVDGGLEDDEEIPGGTVESMYHRVSVKKFIDSLKEEADSNDYKDCNLAFNFHLCSISDESLKRIVNEFFCQPPYKDRIKMVDLSYNELTLTSESKESIKNLLALDSLLYVNLLGTGFALKKIKDFLEYLEGQVGREQTSEYSKKIIFMRKDYIKTAKSKVKVYKDVVLRGILDKDWDAWHFKYYDKSCRFSKENIYLLNSRFSKKWW